jgi:hypothetical protein
LSDLGEESLDRAARGLHGVSRLEASEHLHPASPAVGDLEPLPVGQHHRLHLDRDEQVRRLRRIDADEPARRHADHGEGVIVHQDLLADDVGVASETVDPVVVGQHGDGMPPVDLIVFPRVEDSTDRRLHAEHREEVARHHVGEHALGVAVDADRSGDEAPAHHF